MARRNNLQNADTPATQTDGTSAMSDAATLLNMVHQLQLENAGLRQQTLATQPVVSPASTVHAHSTVDHTAVVPTPLANVGSIPNPPQLAHGTGPAPPQAVQVVQETPAQIVAILAPHARKYSLAFASWVETGDILGERPDIDVDGLARWKDDESYKLGVRAELYDLIPDSARASALANKGTFVRLVNGQRAQAVYNGKIQLDTILSRAGYTSELRAAVATHAYQDPAVLALLKGDGDSYKTRFPPILFPLGEERNMQQLFRSRALVDIARVSLHGRTSVDPGHGPARQNTAGNIQGVHATTAGMIAAASQRLRFLVSPDEQFSLVGNRTGIHYREDEMYLRALIMKKLKKGGKKAREVQQLFQWWDQQLFATSNSINDAAEVNADIRDADEHQALEWDDSDSDDTEGEDEEEPLAAGKSKQADDTFFDDPSSSDEDEDSLAAHDDPMDVQTAAFDISSPADSAQLPLTGHAGPAPAPFTVPSSTSLSAFLEHSFASGPRMPASSLAGPAASVPQRPFTTGPAQPVSGFTEHFPHPPQGAPPFSFHPAEFAHAPASAPQAISSAIGSGDWNSTFWSSAPAHPQLNQPASSAEALVLPGSTGNVISPPLGSSFSGSSSPGSNGVFLTGHVSSTSPLSPHIPPMHPNDASSSNEPMQSDQPSATHTGTKPRPRPRPRNARVVVPVMTAIPGDYDELAPPRMETRSCTKEAGTQKAGTKKASTKKASTKKVGAKKAGTKKTGEA